jgi:hypothetical protein
MKVYAQGDVVLVEVAAVDLPTKRVRTAGDGAVVLAEGEHTGHRHAFYGGALLFHDAALARDIPSDLYIGHVNVGPQGAVLEHGPARGIKGDHDPISIPPGTYVARRQREFTGHAARHVAD